MAATWLYLSSRMSTACQLQRTNTFPNPSRTPSITIAITTRRPVLNLLSNLPTPLWLRPANGLGFVIRVVAGKSCKRQSEFGVLHGVTLLKNTSNIPASFTESIQAAEASVEPIRQEAHYAKDRPTALRRNGDLVREVPAIFAELQWWISSHNRFFCGYVSVVDIWGFPFRVSVLRITSHFKRSLF